jgi:hypothetical protein
MKELVPVLLQGEERSEAAVEAVEKVPVAVLLQCEEVAG